MIERGCSPAEIAAELKVKRERILGFLERSGLDAVLISRHENIAWVTAGIVDVRIGVIKETGAASLLLTKDGSAYYLTTNNEAPRLAEEEFAELDYEPLVKPWYANDVQASIDSVVRGGKVGTDAPFGSLQVVSLQTLRYELTAGEVARYRRLGCEVAEVVTDVVLALRPGVSEKTMQAMLGERLMERGILPSVYLTAVDRRVRSFRHAVPRGGVLERFGMVNFCARGWGLSASMTRFVHFDPLPEELVEKFSVVAMVNARLQAATREGISADALFEVAREAYASAGFAGQETMHHQGGAAGYLEREWVARPGGTEIACATQAFAWNPSLDGAKVEDTILLADGAIELLTPTPGLPVVKTSLNGIDYHSAGVLVA